MATANRGTPALDFTEFGSSGQLGSEYDEATSAWESALAVEDGETPLEDNAAGESPDEEDQDDPQSEEEELESEDEDEGEDDSEDDQDDEGDEEDEDEEDEEPASELDPETKVKVKVDGEETEVTLKELQSGYSRTQDYTRKTQALAEQRRQLEEKEDQVLKQQGEWSQALNELAVRLQASVSGRTEADWQRLKQEDEVAYYEERDKERQVQERIQAIRQEQQRVHQEHQQRQQKHLERAVQEEKEKLLAAIPDWQDQEVATKDYQQMLKYGEAVGFSEQELKGMIDHRAIQVLRDAAKFRALQEKKADPGSKAKVKKRATKPLKAGTPSNEAPSRSKARKAKQRLAKTRTVDAAVPYFEQLLGDE